MMIRRGLIIAMTAVALGLAPGPARACGPDIRIEFYEASGGDAFIITNRSEEKWIIVSLQIQLAGSHGRLIFDTAGGGLGFSMHAPFAADGTKVGLIAEPEVLDGAEQLFLQFDRFAPGHEFNFYVDVDDRLEDSDWGQAHVTGPEMQGASAHAVVMKHDQSRSTAKGRFNNDGKATLRGGLCA